MFDDSLIPVDVFSHCMKVKIFLHIFIMCCFYDLENLRLLLSRTEFWWLLGQSCLKAIKQALSQEKKEERDP
jgi:hypothetical protein